LEVYSANEGRARPDRGERVRMAEMLRGKDTVAGLTLPQVRQAITRHPRRRLTKETTRNPRQCRLGGCLADLCVTLLLWQGREQDPERGPHKSFPELEEETGYTKRPVAEVRRLCVGWYWEDDRRVGGSTLVVVMAWPPPGCSQTLPLQAQRRTSGMNDTCSTSRRSSATAHRPRYLRSAQLARGSHGCAAGVARN
jgi:hypothetical protein